MMIIKETQYTNVNDSVKKAESVTHKEAAEIGINRFLMEKLPSVIHLSLLILLVLVGTLLGIPQVIWLILAHYSVHLLDSK